MKGASRDMKSAYRQLSTHPSQQHMTIVAVWDVALNRWRFAVANALLFGLSGAVLHFNRVPTLLVAFMRRWFAVATQAFFDDFRIVDLHCARGSAVKWFDKVMAWLGWRFDPEKNQAPNCDVAVIG